MIFLLKDLNIRTLILALKLFHHLIIPEEVLDTLLPQGVERDVHRYPVEPCVKSGVGAKILQSFIDANKHILHDVVRVIVGSHDPSRDPIHLFLVPPDKLVETGNVSFTKLIDQLEISFWSKSRLADHCALYVN